MELSRHDGATFIDCTKTVLEYTSGDDWRIKANSNTTYSNAGLVNNTAGKVIANYWLDQVYTPEEGKAHREGDYHIHDLDCLTPYCAGWNLRSLLNEGFNGVRSRVNSRPPHHFRESLGQMANFLGILQSEWAGAQAFSSFDTFLAPYVFRDKMSFKNVKKAIRGFVYNLNVPSRWGQCVPAYYKCKTADGSWKTFNELSKGEAIVVFDVNTGEFKTDFIKRLNIYDAPSIMHKYEGSNGNSFQVTDNHRIVIKTEEGYELIESSKIKETYESVIIPTESGEDTFSISEEKPITDKVWCPTTDTGTFLCMTDEGYVFVTGNSPFTNVTIDWTVPDDLKDSAPLSGGFHLLEGMNDQELISKAVERGVEALEEMTYKHFQPEMNMIQKAYYEVMTEGDSTGQPFTFPIPTVNITEEFDWEGENVLTLFENTAKIGSSYFQNFVGSQYKIDENGNRVEDEEAYKPSAVRSMCCRLQLDLNELRKRGNGLFGSAESTGSIGVVTINLARLGYRFKGDKRGLYKELDRLMVMAKSTLEKKRAVVSELFEKGLYPYTKRYLPGGYRNHFSTIGVNGGNEMIRNFTNGKHDITSKWGAKFAEDLLNYIRKRMKDFQNETGNLYNLEASPGEGATHRFAREDAKRYPDIIQAGCKETGKIYYTNSTQLPSWYTDDLFMALKLQDTLQTRYTGGTVFHMYMSEMVSSPEACRDIVRKILTNFKMPYITVTPLFSVCEKHGYLKGRHDYCPICDDEILQEARSKCSC